MVLNTAGAVFLEDFGCPKIITAKARGTISGGQLCFLSGAAGVVSSGANSFSFGDIEAAAGASGVNFAGVALSTVTSGLEIAIATEGIFLITSAGTIEASRTVGVNGGDAVIESVVDGRAIGRSLCSAGSEGFVLVQIGRS